MSESHRDLRLRLSLPTLLLLLAGAANAATIPVACVGDSITVGAGASSPATSYPSVLAGLLGSGYTVGNFGHSGTTLQHDGDFPYINQAEYSASGAYAPAIVVIMLGTNDSKPQNWPLSSSFATDDAALIQHYRALPSHPLVFSCSVCPVYGSGNYGINEPVVSTHINPLLVQTASAQLAPLIDIYTALSGVPQDFPDNVHPNDAGNALLAQAVYAAIHPPVAAGGLSASAQSATVIVLSWSDLSDNENGFLVERRLGSGSYATLATAAANATAYSDASAQPSSTYTYRVTAFNASGSAAATNEASATTPAAPPAAADSGHYCGHGGIFSSLLLLVAGGVWLWPRARQLPPSFIGLPWDRHRPER